MSPWGWQDDQPFTDSRVKLREKSWPGDGWTGWTGWTGWADADPTLRPGHMVRVPELREIGSCERMLENAGRRWLKLVIVLELLFPHFAAMRAFSWELRNTLYFRRWNCWLFTGSISQAKRHRQSIPKFIGYCAILAWSPGLSFHKTTGRFMRDPQPWMTFHLVYLRRHWRRDIVPVGVFYG